MGWLVWRAWGLALACSVAASGAAIAADSPYRLGGEASPERYQLDITPDLPAMSFHGVERIRVRLAAPARQLVLNAAELTIDQASADGANPAHASLDDKLQRLTLSFDRPLAAGVHEIAVRYAGKINTTSRGLFVAKYDEDGHAKQALATQLESIDARRLFPCWDEPDRKAVFSVSIVVPKGQIAVSNTPVASTTPAGEGLERVSFAPSPKMSPYLLFLGAGEMVRVTRKVGGLEIGLVSSPSVAANSDFTLKAATELLAYYDQYFGVRYPLPKLDFFLVPGSGRPVGMENWGAVFGFEGGFIVNPKTATEGGKSFVYLVIAHELAHQWFGDLVTTRWWDDLWLNEGFASWLQVKASDHFHPEWQPWLAAQDSRDGAMQLDAKGPSHPVISAVEDPAKMDEIFDQITYDKGQAVITMLEAWLGEARFRHAISAYVAGHAYGSATTEELWRGLQATDPDAAEVARAFTARAGLPLLSATIGACKDGRRIATLSQSRFTEEGSVTAQPWPLPVRLGEAGGPPQAYHLVKDDGAEVPVEGCGPVLVNAGQASYLRVAYDDTAFAELLPALGRMTPADQMGLFEDDWALAHAGVVGVGRSLDLIAGLPATAPQPVWSEALSVLHDIDHLYGQGPERDRLRAFARVTLKRIAAGTSDAALRQQAGRALAGYDDPEALAEARADIEKLIGGGELDAQARRMALGVGVAHADAALYDRLVAWMRATSSSEDRTQMLDALALVRDPALAQRTLDLVLSEDMAPGMAIQLLQNLAILHGPAVDAFLKSHEEALSHRLRTIDLAQLKDVGKVHTDTPAERKMKADTDAWLARRG